MDQPKNTQDQFGLLDLVNDVAASLALSTVVTDAAGAAVIHVDGSTTNQLVVTITNQTSGAITISKLAGTSSASNYNVLFKLPNNELYFYDAPTIDASSAPGTWELATDSASGGAGWVDSIYLANTGTCVLTPLGQSGDSVSIVINYGEIVPDDPKALNIPVQVSYQNMTNSSGTALKGTSPAQTMGIMANAGWPSPLLGSIVGPATVLNDGTTAHALTLRMVNTSLDPLQFIVPVNSHPTQSYIEVVLPVSDTATDALWALCNTTSWNAINVALAGTDSAGWTAAKSTTTPGVITLTPDFSKVTNIPAGGEIELNLTGVTSGLEPGMVQANVTLNRFALIGTQTFGVAIEKSPLIYNAGLGNGMHLASGSLGANYALGITGDSSGNLVEITQSGSGQALQVNGGDAVFSNAVKSASANITGALTADSIAASSVAVSGNLTINKDAKIDGVISGSNPIGGGAASVQGYGTGGNSGVFAFKYDRANRGDSPNAIQIWNSSAGVFKTFIVNHPINEAKHLVHATLEGPEGAVYYRGETQLKNGICTVSLPTYFEAFTRKELRTIILTNIDGFDRIAVKTIDGHKVNDGKFVVISENPDSTQKFDWEVKAVRSDGPTLNAEPNKEDVLVGGFGPYTFEMGKQGKRDANYQGGIINY